MQCITMGFLHKPPLGFLTSLAQLSTFPWKELTHYAYVNQISLIQSNHCSIVYRPHSEVQGLKSSVLGTDLSLEDSNHSIHALTIEK